MRLDMEYFKKFPRVTMYTVDILQYEVEDGDWEDPDCYDHDYFYLRFSSRTGIIDNTYLCELYSLGNFWKIFGLPEEIKGIPAIEAATYKSLFATENGEVEIDLPLFLAKVRLKEDDLI